MRRPLAHAAVLVAGLAVVATPLASASAADVSNWRIFWYVSTFLGAR